MMNKSAVLLLLIGLCVGAAQARPSDPDIDSSMSRLTSFVSSAKQSVQMRVADITNPALIRALGSLALGGIHVDLVLDPSAEKLLGNGAVYLYDRGAHVWIASAPTEKPGYVIVDGRRIGRLPIGDNRPVDCTTLRRPCIVDNSGRLAVDNYSAEWNSALTKAHLFLNRPVVDLSQASSE